MIERSVANDGVERDRQHAKERLEREVGLDHQALATDTGGTKSVMEVRRQTDRQTEEKDASNRVILGALVLTPLPMPMHNVISWLRIEVGKKPGCCWPLSRWAVRGQDLSALW